MLEPAYKRLEFYKEIHHNELSRAKEYDTALRFPVTIVIVSIGLCGYIFKNFYPNNLWSANNIKECLFVVFFCLISISIILSIYFLSRLFYGYKRNYLQLNLGIHIRDFEEAYYKRFYSMSKKTSSSERRDDALSKISFEMDSYLIDMYCTCSSHNQQVNDKRADYYYYGRMFLFLTLIFLLVLSILYLIK